MSARGQGNWPETSQFPGGPRKNSDKDSPSICQWVWAELSTALLHVCTLQVRAPRLAGLIEHGPQGSPNSSILPAARLVPFWPVLRNDVDIGSVRREPESRRFVPDGVDEIWAGGGNEIVWWHGGQDDIPGNESEFQFDKPLVRVKRMSTGATTHQNYALDLTCESAFQVDGFAGICEARRCLDEGPTWIPVVPRLVDVNVEIASGRAAAGIAVGARAPHATVGHQQSY